MATIDQQVKEILNNGALLAALDNQMDADAAASMEHLSDVELFSLIADKTISIRDSQLIIAGASRLLQQRHLC